jgi:glycine oxidase
MNSDVIIIGGGLIGCATAMELAARGLQVRLFERGQPGREASWASAGMLAPQTEAEKGGPFFELCRQSRDLYEPFVEKLREVTGLDPCYRTEGSIQIAIDEAGAQAMESSYAWQFAAGLAIERLSGEDVRKLEPALTPSVLSAVFFPLEYQVDSRKLVGAVISAAERCGVEFHPGAAVTEIIVEGRVARGVMANGERHEAARVINAAGSWAGMLGMKGRPLPTLVPVRGQIVALKTPANRLSHVIHFGHNYLVPRWDGTVLVGSTSEFVGYDKRVTATGLETLLERAQLIAPALGEAEFLEAWAGLRPATTDGLPLLGTHPEIEGLIFATGHYRNGILLTPITAKLIAESILNGRDAAQLAPFNPARLISAQQSAELEQV